MFSVFYPDTYVNTAYEIDYEALFAAGCRGIIFDIDNTLVPHDAPADDKSVALFKRLRAIGFKTLILSNNKEPRVKMFCDAVGSPYLFKAAKPKRDGYLKAMELMGTDLKNTIFIGDQLFTDMRGANRTGIKTILVKPIHPKERLQIVLKRIPERLILFFYKRRVKREKKLSKNS